jgi:hypothetical protein
MTSFNSNKSAHAGVQHSVLSSRQFHFAAH